MITLFFVHDIEKESFFKIDVENKFKELIKEVCDDLKIEIIAIETDQDHAHLFLNALPTWLGGCSIIRESTFDEINPSKERNKLRRGVKTDAVRHDKDKILSKSLHRIKVIK